MPISVHTPTCTGTLVGTHFRIVYEPGAHETLATAQAAFEAFRPVLGGQRLPVLIDARTMAGLDREAQDFYARGAGALWTRVAIVVEGLVPTMAANLYLTIFAPETPTKVFRSEEDALAWLGVEGRAQ